MSWFYAYLDVIFVYYTINVCSLNSRGWRPNPGVRTLLIKNHISVGCMSLYYFAKFHLQSGIRLLIKVTKKKKIVFFFAKLLVFVLIQAIKLV